MTIHRRDLLALALAASPLARAAAGMAATPARLQSADPPMRFPVDFGAHPDRHTEWWYMTGSLLAGSRRYGFQVTFFRSNTGVAADNRSRFAARELVFAHAAVSDVEQRRLRHDQRIARPGFGVARAPQGDTDVALRDWHLIRRAGASGASGASGTGGTGNTTNISNTSNTSGTNGDNTTSRYETVVTSDSNNFGFDLVAETTQPVLLQGDAGLSRKGPRPEQTSRYYSEPQLAVTGRLTLDGRAQPVTGRAWLDHEWSDAYLDPQAVGWDWIGMNLDDGSALTAFRLRRADGTPIHAGGSFRRPGEAARDFADSREVRFTPGRSWRSASSQAAYPVDWTIDTPAGRFQVKALIDDQELDSRGSTGSIYWEGLSELHDGSGRKVGLGYLEMTGYASALKM